MKQKQLYLIVVGFAILVVAAMMLSNIHPTILSRSQQAGIAQTAPQVTPVVLEERVALSIEDIKNRTEKEVKTPQKEPSSLAYVYSQYSKEDAGGNMVAAWAKVSPEEKTKVFEQLDQQIAQAQGVLKANPADKNAKHTLFIAQTVKEMCLSNFDYNLLESIPKDQSGAKPRPKK